ncbi:MAG: hypothetical protein QXD48_03450 [Candidatus Aenigmatarchaeota archaeon]
MLKNFNLWDKGVLEALKAVGRVTINEKYNACFIGGLAVSVYLLKDGDKDNSKLLVRDQYSRNISDFDIIYCNESIINEIENSLKYDGFGIRRGDIFSPTDFHQLYAIYKNFQIPIHLLRTDGYSPGLIEPVKTLYKNILKNKKDIYLFKDNENYTIIRTASMEDLILSKINTKRQKDKNDLIVLLNHIISNNSYNLNLNYINTILEELKIEMPDYIEYLFKKLHNKKLI